MLELFEEEVAQKNPGETNCLGWCNKTFFSPDKNKIRFCPKCRDKKNGVSSNMSRVEIRCQNTGLNRDLIED